MDTATPSAAGLPAPLDRDIGLAWARSFAARLIVSDVAVIALSVFGSQVIWIGLTRNHEILVIPEDRPGPIGYTVFSVLLIIGWMASLAISSTRDHRVVGIGVMEYRRVIGASVRLASVLAIVIVLLQFNFSRGYLVTAFLAATFLLLVSRWLWRKWLIGKRLSGGFSSRALLVGSAASIGYIAEQLARFPNAGYRAVGACIPSGNQVSIGGVPVVGHLGAVSETAKTVGADTVILTSSDDLPPQIVKRISWSLESQGIELAVAPALIDIAGPRIHVRPLAGLPLLHVEVPRYEGSKRTGKAVFDFGVSLIALVLMSPVLLVIALAVGFSSRGPIFFLQQRVGLNGHIFRMIKFRTMQVGAEEEIGRLRADNNADGLLFKLRDDPRVTKVGKFLRRYSLDELPQFVNVLIGDMSIVGPRPPLVSEAERYEPEVRRRLLVKPGITGPWQISGRSDLSWDEGVRLDLFYVENWTLAGDIILIARTVNAVLRKHGAY